MLSASKAVVCVLKGNPVSRGLRRILISLIWAMKCRKL